MRTLGHAIKISGNWSLEEIGTFILKIVLAQIVALDSTLRRKVAVHSLLKLYVPKLNVFCALRAPEHFFKIYNLNKVSIPPTTPFVGGSSFRLKRKKKEQYKNNNKTDRKEPLIHHITTKRMFALME